jgi:hypothetical protein
MLSRGGARRSDGAGLPRSAALPAAIASSNSDRRGFRPDGTACRFGGTCGGSDEGGREALEEPTTCLKPHRTDHQPVVAYSSHQFIYVFIATSANFGNILSMAGVSLVLSFLPLLPKHILLTWVESLPS